MREMVFTITQMMLLVTGFSLSILLPSSTTQAFVVPETRNLLADARRPCNIELTITSRQPKPTLSIRNNPRSNYVYPSMCATVLYGVRIRDWKEGDGKHIMDLLRSVESGFNPEGPLEIDCGSEDSIQESYSEDGACMLVATTDDKSDRIFGTAALIVGTPVTYLRSGASLSSPGTTGAVRRVCAVDDDAERTGDSVLRSLVTNIEDRAAEAGVSELIALAYPDSGTSRRRTPNVALLEGMGYTKLPGNLDGVDVVQYYKLVGSRSVVKIDAEESLSRTNGGFQDVTIAAAVLTAIFLALVGVATFMGFELIPSSDNRGIGSPLSVQELRILRQEEKLQRTDLDGGQTVNEGGRQWTDLSFEERQEEGALMKIIQGKDARLK